MQAENINNTSRSFTVQRKKDMGQQLKVGEPEREREKH